MENLKRAEKIVKKVILLIPFKDYSKNDLLKYIPPGYLGCAGYGKEAYPYDLYYYEPLRELFSEVIVYDYVEHIISGGINSMNQKLIELVRRERPAYVIWVSAYFEFPEKTFDLIRKEGSRIVGFFFDDEWRFNLYSKWWIPHIDYFVTNDSERVSSYMELGARAVHTAPYNGIPVDVNWEKVKEKHDVSFVGDKKYDRARYIDAIRQKDIQVSVFGAGWGTRYVPFSEMIDIFTNSKINLNFSKALHKKMGWKGRIFQVCMAGGFLLTEYRPGIENYFEIGKEIVCFDGIKEMLGKIEFYLNHDVERRAIARAGWEKAAGKYTPFQMMAEVFDKIFSMEKAGSQNRETKICHLRISRRMRKDFSHYYYRWGVGLLASGSKRSWKDAFNLSLSYDHFNMWAWSFRLIGFLPCPLRFLFFNSYNNIKSILKPLFLNLKKHIPFLDRISMFLPWIPEKSGK